MTIVAIVADGESALAVVPLLLITLSYVVWGRTAVRSATAEVPVRESWWHAGVMVALFPVAHTLATASAVALSALIPMAFMSFRTAQAVAVMVAMWIAPGIQILELTGIHPLITTGVMTVMFSASALLGVFIDRLGRQNHERALLIEELERTRGELAEVSKEAGVLAERERLAGDIHDTLAQGFTGIIMLLQGAAAAGDQNVALAVRTAKENLAETRALIAALAPPALTGASLEEALTRLAKGFELPVEVSVRGEPVPLPAAVELALVRAAQESLANVRKHAGGGAARLSVDYGAASVRLSVRDDGRGFDPAAATAATDGYGLRAMRGRVGALGGTLTVDSAPGSGTQVTVELPCSVL
ncbi:sensor histidine kinase [Nonomuraea antri]|uniref:sensor histidine kinase n=1 Tax=Nonomuraea antri TaxID=2730852 RepID=UPI001C2C4044|nr:sensor histidine kinase [Nonomuraea antri]